MRRWFGARSIRRRFAVQYREQQNDTTGAGDRASKEAYMAVVRAEDIYEQHIKLLPATERLRLLAIVAQDLATQPADEVKLPQRSIMELHGLGKDLWEGIDAQEYVNELRKEWDHRP